MKQKKMILLFLLIVILIPPAITIAKFVAKFTYNLFLEASNFYFSSDKLTENNRFYQINNWSGVDTFQIQFELNNKKNSLVYSTSDIAYTISVECEDGVICNINSSSGVIEVEENVDNFNVSVTPTRAFLENEKTTVVITARATSPYRKTISATFEIKVGKSGLSYEINDKANQPYMMLLIANARSGYKVVEAFGDYQIGDELSQYEYSLLNENEKTKCRSARVTITFNPSKVVIDTTSNIINKAVLGYATYQGVSYINSLEFDVDAYSNTDLRFYKVDVTKDYTYPFGNNTSIISFSAE